MAFESLSDEVCLCVRAFSGLFVIDPKGNLRIIVVHDMPVGRSVDEAIRVVQALQFNEKHGEGALLC